MVISAKYPPSTSILARRRTTSTGRGRGGRGGRGGQSRGRGGGRREGASPTSNEIADALNGMMDVQMHNNNDDNDDEQVAAAAEPPMNNE